MTNLNQSRRPYGAGLCLAAAASLGLWLAPLAHADDPPGLTEFEQLRLVFLYPFDHSPNGDAGLTATVFPHQELSQLIETDLAPDQGTAVDWLTQIRTDIEVAFFNDFNNELAGIEGAISNVNQTIQSVDDTVIAVTSVVDVAAVIAGAAAP